MLTSKNLSKIPGGVSGTETSEDDYSIATTADSRSLHSAGSIETENNKRTTKRSRKLRLTGENLLKLDSSSGVSRKLPRDMAVERDRSLDRLRKRGRGRSQINKFRLF